MMPLLFVMGLTWCALWMPVEDRFDVGFVTLLAVVAFHALITDQLPRLSYPTFVDYLLTVCYVFTSVLIGGEYLGPRHRSERRGAGARDRTADPLDAAGHRRHRPLDWHCRPLDVIVGGAQVPSL